MLNEQEYFCITQMCLKEDQIRSWIKNDSTINFLKTWEQIYNPNFKFVNLPRDKRSPTKWVKLTNAMSYCR